MVQPEKKIALYICALLHTNIGLHINYLNSSKKGDKRNFIKGLMKNKEISPIK